MKNYTSHIDRGPHEARILPIHALILLLILILPACRTKKLQTELQTDSILVTASTDETLRHLTELLSLTLSTRVAVIDSLHTHSETVLTLDADGKVTGGTRKETANRHRVTHIDEQSDSRQEQSVIDSAANHAASSSALHSEGRSSQESRTEVTVRPVWERAVRWGVALMVSLIVLGTVVGLRRRHVKKRT
ncbi:MAG: hypothetical protein HDR80_04805 [Bacteroides sp.]|nr:hypothetical protein [Bacteroides sp.]